VAKVYVNDCIEKVLQGTLDNTTSAIAKYWVTDTEYPIAHMFRNARISRIYGGSNEIMKMLIARSL
jgi:hypothetical protein